MKKIIFLFLFMSAFSLDAMNKKWRDSLKELSVQGLQEYYEQLAADKKQCYSDLKEQGSSGEELSEIEERYQDLKNKVDFVKRLLAQQKALEERRARRRKRTAQ